MQGTWKRASYAKRCHLENATDPIGGNLPETEAATMESFLEYTHVLLPMLGVNVFQPTDVEAESSATKFHLTLPKSGIKARAIESSGGITVLAKSEVATRERQSCPPLVSKQRQDLRQSGVLEALGDHLVFAVSHTFGSPSLAAAVAVGGATNGQTAWKTA